MVPALSLRRGRRGRGRAADRGPSQCPCDAWCDADQALTPAEFAALMKQLDAVRGAGVASIGSERGVVTPRLVATAKRAGVDPI